MTLQRLLWTCCQLFVAEFDVDRTCRDVDDDDVAILDLSDVATGCCLRADVSDGKARSATRETSVGDEGTFLAHVHRLDVGCRIKHLLHAWSTLGTFVGDDDAIAFLDLAAENAFASILLRVKAYGRTFEMPEFRSHACGLDDATILSDIAEEHSQAAILGVGMFDVADATIGTIGVECLPLSILRTHLDRELAGRSTVIDAACFGVDVLLEDGILLDVLTERCTIDTLATEVEQIALGEFAEDAEDAACTVLLLHRILLRIGSKFAEARNHAAQTVDVLHLEIHATLLRYGKQVKHGVRRATHGDVEGHGVEECCTSGDAAWQNALVALLIIFQCVLDNQLCGVLEELDTIHVGSQNRTVAGQRESDGLGK